MCRLKWVAILTFAMFSCGSTLLNSQTLSLDDAIKAAEVNNRSRYSIALHGGPLWEALCYAQIGGLTVATAVTLFIVPVLYSIFVLDLRIIRWEESVATPSGPVVAASPRVETTAAEASA